MTKRTLIILAVAGAIVIAIGATALAKGPESATITGPGIGEPIELINDDYFGTDYTDHVKDLMAQTGLWFASGSGTGIAGEPPGDLGVPHTLTWINGGPPGDPVELRIIHQLIYLHAQGGPVIHTPSQVGLEGWGPEVIGWTIAPDGLVDTLAALGVPTSLRQSDKVGAPLISVAALPIETASTDRTMYLIVMIVGFAVALVWIARRIFLGIGRRDAALRLRSG